MSRLTRFLTLAAVLSIFPLAAAAQANLNGFGVVLMHGKGGGPGGLVASTAAALQGAGAKVIMPEMPWSRSRSYDVTYEQAMAEIDRAVAQLKAQGATKIVVAGQSFGANAAIGYAARRDGLAAVVALAPGHVRAGTDAEKRRGNEAGGIPLGDRSRRPAILCRSGLCLQPGAEAPEEQISGGQCAA